MASLQVGHAYPIPVDDCTLEIAPNDHYSYHEYPIPLHESNLEVVNNTYSHTTAYYANVRPDAENVNTEYKGGGQDPAWKTSVKRHRKGFIVAGICAVIILAVVVGIVMGVVKKKKDEGPESTETSSSESGLGSNSADKNSKPSSSTSPPQSLKLAERSDMSINSWINEDNSLELHLYFQDSEGNVRDLAFSSKEGDSWKSTKDPEVLFKAFPNTPIASALWIEGGVDTKQRIYYINEDNCLSEWNIGDKKENGLAKLCYEIGKDLPGLSADARNPEKDGKPQIDVLIVIKDDLGNVRSLKGPDWQKSKPVFIKSTSFRNNTSIELLRVQPDGSRISMMQIEQDEGLDRTCTYAKPELEYKFWYCRAEEVGAYDAHGFPLIDERPENKPMLLESDFTIFRSGSENWADTKEQLIYQLKDGLTVKVEEEPDADRNWSANLYPEALTGEEIVQRTAIACAQPRKAVSVAGGVTVESLVNVERLSRCFFQVGDRKIREVSFWDGKWDLVGDIELF